MNAKACVIVLSALLSIAAFPGCSSAPKNAPVPVPDANALTGGREWWDVYSAEFVGDRKVRSKVGYLYRKYNADNTGGAYFVKNMEQEDLGFLLPNHKAFLIKKAPGKNELVSEDLGIADLNLGVKKILGASGSIELEKVALKPEGK